MIVNVGQETGDTAYCININRLGNQIGTNSVPAVRLGFLKGSYKRYLKSRDQHISLVIKMISSVLTAISYLNTLNLTVI